MQYEKMKVDDVIARLLMRQRFVVIEGEVRELVFNQLCPEMSIHDCEDRGIWRIIGKRVVHSMVIKDDVLYIYVEKE